MNWRHLSADRWLAIQCSNIDKPLFLVRLRFERLAKDCDGDGTTRSLECLFDAFQSQSIDDKKGILTIDVRTPYEVSSSVNQLAFGYIMLLTLQYNPQLYWVGQAAQVNEIVLDSEILSLITSKPLLTQMAMKVLKSRRRKNSQTG